MKIKTNGIELNVHDTGAGRTTLLYLHYWGGSSRTWHPVMEALPDGYRHVAPDLRGWGESGQAAAYGIEDMAQDVLGVVRAMALERYVVVGHSMGGKVAQWLASAHPRGLRGLVLVAPSPPLPLPLTDEQRGAMAQAYDSEASVGVVLDHVLTATRLPDDLRSRAIADSLRGAAAAKQAWPFAAMREDISGRAGAIDVPVLVLSGELDQVDPAPALRSHLLPVIRHAQLEILPQRGHLLPLEDPESVARAIHRFVSVLPA